MTSNRPRKNRLAAEKSPYLLQHALNPVDWYPWGVEAFAEAKERDVPIFLSIGYASCHWCHVMEQESFQSPKVAEVMNENFVNIKVDREELPEVDNLYMDFAQGLMPGAPGWPLNIVLTPDLKPFFAATYLPPFNRDGMMGLVPVLEEISSIWDSKEREKVLQHAASLTESFRDAILTEGEEMPDSRKPMEAAELIYHLSDPMWGGLSGSPKFPIGYQPIFLIRHTAITRDARAMFMAEKTLDMMQRGGIYDHIGGGFSRYSVDAEWRVPHFEKMLYDNALLVDAYLELYQATQKSLYKEIAKECLSYVERVLKAPEGAFYASESADSNGEEGAYYGWTKDEVVALLGKSEGELVTEFYGNFRDKNLPYIHLREAEFAELKGISQELVEEALKEGKEKLLLARGKRKSPKIDDKILVSWNGLMIHALAKAYLILGDSNYLESAERAAAFIKKNLFKEDKLYRRYRDKEVRYEAGLDDYAFLIRGLIELFLAGGKGEWLDFAEELNAILKFKFKSVNGAYYIIEQGAEHLILRKCVYTDGAEPSGNAIQCENLLRLSLLTADQGYLDDAKDIFRGVKEFVDNYPPGYIYHLANLEFYNVFGDVKLAIVALGGQVSDEAKIRAWFQKIYNPLLLVVYRRQGDEELAEASPMLNGYKPKEGKTTLYLCRQGVCESALSVMDDIEEAILKLG